MFYEVDVTAKGLEAMMMKQEAILNNIANADTPNYTRQDVAFESVLAQEIQKTGTDNLNVDNLSPKLYKDTSNLATRVDGNNVDIDIEMTELVKNQMKYNTLIERTKSQLSRYKSILQTLK
jgi:flagellar basal-body rod protein FlgB